MAEAFNPIDEGRRIASEYLSRRLQARQWRDTLDRQARLIANREEFEERLRQCDRLEEGAEEVFNNDFESWRKNPSSHAKEVFQGIYEILGNRHDLGFIAKQIVDRIRRTLSF